MLISRIVRTAGRMDYSDATVTTVNMINRDWLINEKYFMQNPFLSFGIPCI
jgi:hypothetical protein